ncbi:efflux transporter outer membrane subunit [Agarivorans sp. QJM3NY_25]|uniref:efflux transporter outer membrane subunit n=1 Tax=Agarivorans sp. QJM3NY_25 TaxID=3421430 RepID=UPI003D7CCA7C
MMNSQLYKYSTVGLAMSLLTACSHFSRSEFHPPEVLTPQVWQDAVEPSEATTNTLASRSLSQDRWWEKFNNPELDRLIEQVLQTNNNLSLATLTLHKARLEAGLSEDQLYPQLSSSLSAGRSKDFNDGASSGSYQANISVGYQVDLWGKVAADIDQARWLAIASAEDRESTAQSLVATTASLYWQLGYLKQRVSLSNGSIKDAQQTLQLTQSQYQSGAVTILNVLEAKRSLASLQANHSQWLQQLHEAQNALAILFNQPPAEDQLQIKQLPEGPMPLVIEGVPADILVRRPDVKAALYQLKAALAGKDSSTASYLPALSLTGSLGSSSNQLKELLRNPIGTLGAELALPFLQWNQLQLNQQISEVQYQSAVVQYRQTLYQAFEDVDNALSARQQYLYQGQRLIEQYQSAKEVERIYQSQYRNGAVGIKDWLDAQEQLRNAEALLLENRYQQFVTQATLYLALGGSDIAPQLAGKSSDIKS